MTRKAGIGAIGAVSPNFYLLDGVVPRTRLPEVMRSMGRGAKEFKKGLQDDLDEDAEATKGPKDDTDDKDEGASGQAG